MSEEGKIDVSSMESGEVDLGEVGVVDEFSDDEIVDARDEIETFINSVDTKDYNDAENQFASMVNDRLQDALDQARSRIAGTIYNKTAEAE